jgi:hypothetical protein
MLSVFIASEIVVMFLCKMSNKCAKEPVGFINVFKIYPNMFRQVVAILRVL